MIWIFPKHPIDLKWYQFFWNALYISNYIKYYETPCINTIMFNTVQGNKFLI